MNNFIVPIDFSETSKNAARYAAHIANLVPDAHLTAILFQHGVGTLYSNDRDFRKFPAIDVRDPFA